MLYNIVLVFSFIGKFLKSFFYSLAIRGITLFASVSNFNSFFLPQRTESRARYIFTHIESRDCKHDKMLSMMRFS